MAEFVAKGLPPGHEWAVLAGLEECARLFEGLNVTVRSLPEGAVFGPGDPVMTIEGRYLDFGVYETAILGFLCQASGIATKAARCKLAAGKRTVLSFGARRMHPALAPMIERNAFIGGCDGVATVAAAELLGIPASGTIPHALVLIVGSAKQAVQFFDEVIDETVPRIALIDTFCDEKSESLSVAEALGNKLSGVRVDTPSSRRGNLREILREIRWELDLRGYEHVKIFVSGGLDEESISKLNAFADGYGVGTSISNATVIDFSMDIVEIEGKPVSKRGKCSGKKAVFRCSECLSLVVVPSSAPAPQTCPCGGVLKDAVVDVASGGNLVFEKRTAEQIREAVLAQVAKLAGSDAGAD